ncbi:hypothetical protein C0J52_02600 [Blattella germanica]|nr:hypothetical protein C0J52_02600 [Blattella germanica]
MCGFVFARGTNMGHKFSLASNIAECCTFDDLVYRFTDKGEDNCLFVQLKNIINKTVTTKSLISMSGKKPFSLYKYYDSFVKIKEKILSKTESLIFNGRFDNCLFVLYTNTDIEDELKIGEEPMPGFEDILSTGGSKLRFHEYYHRKIYKAFEHLPHHKEFLQRVVLMYNQANDSELDVVISGELEKCLNFPEDEATTASTFYIDRIHSWWMNSNFYLSESWNAINPLRQTSEHIGFVSANRLLTSRRKELANLKIEFNDTVIEELKMDLENTREILIVTPGRSIQLTVTKIYQVLSRVSEFSVVNLNDFETHLLGILQCWELQNLTLVVEIPNSDKDWKNIFFEIRKVLNRGPVQMSVIFIVEGRRNTQINSIRNTFRNLKVIYDNFAFIQLKEECRLYFLDKILLFQGYKVKLSAIAGTESESILKRLDPDSLDLLESGNPRIGLPLQDSPEQYIERTLQSHSVVNKAILKESDVVFAFSGVEESALRNYLPSEERLIKVEDLKKPEIFKFVIINSAADFEFLCNMDYNVVWLSINSESLVWIKSRGALKLFRKHFNPKVSVNWCPRTVLEGENKVVLITSEGGMGKSTLLSHLALQSKKVHPQTWIVRINLNDYTQTLMCMQENGVRRDDVIKLLETAVGIGTSGNSSLEYDLFYHCCNFSGNMAVLLDGVDEVTPAYYNEVLNVIKILIDLPVQKIWITARLFLKENLQQEFNIISYSLLPFSEGDALNFLVKYWKKLYPNIEEDILHKFAKRVRDLVALQFKDQESTFMGVPLQTLLLAELFEEKLVDAELIADIEQNINLLSLCEIFVGKKWEVYLRDKKSCDLTNVCVMTDHHILHDNFIKNHKLAAIISTLSTADIWKLTDDDLESQALDFLHRICNCTEKTGLIREVINGKPRFVHRTLAEYFVALWLFENIERSKCFLQDHLWESRLEVTRMILDRILARDFPLHTAVINGDWAQFQKLQLEVPLDQKDKGGRTAMHLAICYNRIYQAELLLDDGVDVNISDSLVEWSPLRYAIEGKHWTILSMVLEKRPDVRERHLKTIDMKVSNHATVIVYAAIQCGYVSLLTYMISNGFNVNTVLPEGITLLHLAVREHQTETVVKLVQLGADINLIDSKGKTPLHWAAEFGYLDPMQALIETYHIPDTSKTVLDFPDVKPLYKIRNFFNNLNKSKKEKVPCGEQTNLPNETVQSKVNKNVPLHLRDHEGNTPLILAAKEGHLNALLYLTAVGSVDDHQNKYGNTALTIAAGAGHDNIVSILLEKGCDVTCQALTAACASGQFSTAKLLLKASCYKDPLHAAAVNGQLEVIKLLVANYASLDWRFSDDDTVLHLVCAYGHVDALRYLIFVKPSLLNCVNKKGETPFYTAVLNDRIKVVEHFINMQCSPETTTVNGYTPLHIASEQGNLDVVSLLLNINMSLNVLNVHQETPLFLAASKGHSKIVNCLLEKGADSTLRAIDGLTPFLVACREGHYETARRLINHGCCLQDVDLNGDSCVHHASGSGNIHLVELLKKANVDLHTINKAGETPVFKAVLCGYDLIVQYLLRENSDVSFQRKDGCNILTLAIRKGNIGMTSFLFNWETCLSSKFSPVFTAAEYGHRDILHFLKEKGVCLAEKNNLGQTVLHTASYRGHLEVVEYLTHEGIDIQLADSLGKTALHYAVESNSIAIVQCLLNCSFTKYKISKLLHLQDVDGNVPLHTAAAEGYSAMCDLLIRRGSGVNFTNKNGSTALHLSTQNGHHEISELLIRMRAKVNEINKSWSTPLHIASTIGHIGLCKSLIENGAKPNLSTKDGHTALHLASMNGYYEVCELLITNGCWVNFPSSNGSVALHGAAQNGHESVCQLLLYYGTAVDVLTRDKCTPLHRASANGHYDLCRMLISRGAKVNLSNCEGETPLHEAARNGDIKVCDLLIKQGSLPNASTNDCRTPLYLAVEKGHLFVVKLLLCNGAEVDVITIDGITALHKAAENGHKETLELLIAMGANVNLASNHGLTPLHFASQSGQLEAIEVLVRNGALTNVVDENCETPLHLAPNSQILQRLIDSGASVNLADKNGNSPLHKACARGDSELVKVLLDSGANVNAVDKTGGSTPLHCAVERGDTSIAELLICNSADLEATNTKGLTPLNVAQKQGHRLLENFLRARAYLLNEVPIYHKT